MRRRKTSMGGGTATVLGAAGILLVLAAWELLSQAGVLDKASFPPPSKVVPELFKQLGDGSFWSAVGDTFTSAALGLAITIVVGIPLGIAIGLSRTAYLSSRVLVEMLKPIPPVAILPLGLIIYGTTLRMKLLLVVFGTLWPLLIQVVDGVRDVDPVQVDTARVYRFGWRRTISDVVLPTSLPYIATGLRLAAVAAFVLSIVTELVGGASGLGLSMQYAQNGADYTTLYALILASGLLGLAINQAFACLERPLLHWHPSQRREVVG